MQNIFEYLASCLHHCFHLLF